MQRRWTRRTVGGGPYRRLRRSYAKNRDDLLGLIGLRYPRFIFDPSPGTPANIPVFVFHDESEESSVPILDFLAQNDYETLTADEYHRRTLSGTDARQRAVLLTFDDGLRNLYMVAYPALRARGQRAVAYVIPGLVPERMDESSSDPHLSTLCDWTRVAEMGASGVIDIQCHSMYHHSVAGTPRVVDFARGGSGYSFLLDDFAPRPSAGDGRAAALPAGTPIHLWAPRYGAAPAYLESPEVAAACVDMVGEHGGEAFFSRPSWRAELRATLKRARSSCPPGRFESVEEQSAAILDDLVAARREIERRLPGHSVKHFCFPWYQGSELAARLSAKAGYTTNAWGAFPPESVRRLGRPLAIPRLLGLYAWRLPGRGRKSLGEVLRYRAGRMI